LPVEPVNKVSEGGRHIGERIRVGEVDLIINTPLGSTAHTDGLAIRTSAIRYGVPLLTTLSAAQAAVNGIRALREKELKVRSLQQHHGGT
ncbi:MAG: carbamoyl-phosphate synthase large subunit, partial [Ardenticatenaceae bacterium]